MDSILKAGLLSQGLALVMGILLHASAVMAGRTYFYEHIFTPWTDVAFVPWITIGGLAGTAGLLFRRRRPKPLWRAGLFVSVYFLVSIPVHLKTMVTWSTGHFMVFPSIYSVFVIPLQLAFLAIVALELRSLRDGDAPSRADARACHLSTNGRSGSAARGRSCCSAESQPSARIRRAPWDHTGRSRSSSRRASHSKSSTSGMQW